MSDAEQELRVLVVDDSHDAANGLTAVLISANYSAQAAYDGQSALVAASNFRPHVVLLDIDMPHMIGYATASGCAS
ncbi:MAG: response regulator [Candidatus Binatota bacterium]|nr:response regulator [Candidatus Binatota bacterium]